MIAEIAQALPMEVNWQTLVFAYGPMGVMLWWFANTGARLMREMIGEIRVLGHRINGMQRAMLADVMSRDAGGNRNGQEFAEKELQRIEREEEVEEIRKAASGKRKT
jgi:hypothetical protein